jgi:hypothetical protein
VNWVVHRRRRPAVPARPAGGSLRRQRASPALLVAPCSVSSVSMERLTPSTYDVACLPMGADRASIRKEPAVVISAPRQSTSRASMSTNRRSLWVCSIPIPMPTRRSSTSWPRISNRSAALSQGFAEPSRLVACYEAGPTGDELASATCGSSGFAATSSLPPSSRLPPVTRRRPPVGAALAGWVAACSQSGLQRVVRECPGRAGDVGPGQGVVDPPGCPKIGFTRGSPVGGMLILTGRRRPTIG